MWHVIWFHGDYLLGIDLSAACIIASEMFLIFWSMLLVK